MSNMKFPREQREELLSKIQNGLERAENGISDSELKDLVKEARGAISEPVPQFPTQQQAAEALNAELAKKRRAQFI